MFGRKKGDDYDEYNESINAKYDDDYIRENEEYRAECSHSHDQTYENYDSHKEQKEYREECEHSHEQTYEDFNSELAPYEAQSEAEAKFVKYLQQGEHILWCAKAEKNANSAEKGTGCVGGGGIALVIVIAVLLLPLFGVMSIAAIIMAVVIAKETNVKNRTYAITDKSLIIMKGDTPKRIPLDGIRGINYKASPRDVGYVIFHTSYKINGIATNKNDGIFAVRDPNGVSEILSQAVSDKHRYSGSVNNG